MKSTLASMIVAGTVLLLASIGEYSNLMQLSIARRTLGPPGRERQCPVCEAYIHVHERTPASLV